MCVSYEAGQVHRTILTACPSSLAAGKTVTPVIQAYEHSMESVCVSVCVCSQETVTVRGGEERGALLTRVSWMCGRTHCWQWPNHDGDSTTSTWKGKSFREQNFASDDTVMQQSLNEKNAITHFNYTFIQRNITWWFLANNSKDASITVHHHWLCDTHKKNSKYLNNLSYEQVLNCFHCKRYLLVNSGGHIGVCSSDNYTKRYVINFLTGLSIISLSFLCIILSFHSQDSLCVTTEWQF